MDWPLFTSRRRFCCASDWCVYHCHHGLGLMEVSRVSALIHAVRPSSEALFFFGHVLPRFLLMEGPIVRQAQPTGEASPIDLSDAMEALLELDD